MCRTFSLEYDHIVKLLSQAFFSKISLRLFLLMSSYLFPSSLLIITSLYFFCAVFFHFFLSSHLSSSAEFFRNISSANCVHCRFLAYSRVMWCNVIVLCCVLPLLKKVCSTLKLYHSRNFISLLYSLLVSFTFLYNSLLVNLRL